jgi:hypothetical protein
LAIVAVLTFALFIYLPVRLIPGNDVVFQLQILGWGDYLILGTLSVLNALLIHMHYHVFREKRRVRRAVSSVAASGAGGMSAIFASVLSTATCSSCVAGLLGFLGTGGILFVLDHRWIFVSAALMIVSIAIILASRQIQGDCAACAVVSGD